MNRDSIVLVGPRGCGKTSVGQSLSRLSYWPFIDADAEFRRYYGEIDDFVTKQGWESFREAEVSLLERICNGNSDRRIILAVGGGAVTHNQGEVFRLRNVQLLKANSHSIFYLLPYANLGISAVILANRVAQDNSSALQRPALTEISDPYIEMFSVLHQRDTLYRAVADYSLETRRKNPEQIAWAMAAKIRAETSPRPLALTA